MARLPTYQTLNGVRFGVLNDNQRGMLFWIDDRPVSEGEYLKAHAEAFAKEIHARRVTQEGT